MSKPPSKSLLIAEDNAFIRRLMVQMIGEVNPNVIPAKDGAEALAILNARGAMIQGVITDIAMPFKNGLEVIKTIRSGGTGAHWTLPIAVITGNAEMLTIEQCMALEVDVVMLKPITRGETLRRIGWMISPESREDRFLAFKDRDPEEFREIDIDVDKFREPDPKLLEIKARERELGTKPRGIKTDVKRLEVGMRLAEPVFSAHGKILLSAGQVLTQRNIVRLQDMGTLEGDPSTSSVWVDVGAR